MNLAGRGTLLAMITAMAFFMVTSLPVTTSLVKIWSNDTSFYHAFFVLPIFITAFIIKSEIFDIYPIRFEPLTIPALAITNCAMVIAFIGGINLIAHFFFVLSIILIAIAALGRHIVKYNFALFFFLFFAVPFGTEFIIPLQNFTADVAVFLLRLSSIDVLHQGIHIITPNAKFYVAQSCAGLRFLIANIFVCYIFAYLNFRTRKSWILFALISCVIPILGNCLRAYLIMLIGHLTSGAYASGIDHIIYGWGFFTLLALINLFIGDRLAKSESDFIETETEPNIPFGVYDKAKGKFSPYYHLYEKRIFIAFCIILLLPAALYHHLTHLQQKHIFDLTPDFTKISMLKFNDELKQDLIVDHKGADHQAAFRLSSTIHIQFSHYNYQNADKDVTSSTNNIFNEENRFLLFQDTITHQDIVYALTISGFANGRKYLTLSTYYFKDGEGYQFTNSKLMMHLKGMLNLLYYGDNSGGVIVIDKIIDNRKEIKANLTELLDQIAFISKSK